MYGTSGNRFNKFNVITNSTETLRVFSEYSSVDFGYGEGNQSNDDRYVGMSFISGNFDETVYTNPFEIDFNRGRNPHLSFGFGPHTCLGNHITEIEAKVFLEAILSSGLSWKVTSEEIRYHQVPYTKVPDHFGSIKITAH